MMSIGIVASVAVMVRFILRDMPRMVMTVGGSALVGRVVGLDLRAHLRRNKAERKLQCSNTPIVGTWDF